MIVITQTGVLVSQFQNSPTIAHYLGRIVFQFPPHSSTAGGATHLIKLIRQWPTQKKKLFWSESALDDDDEDW